MGVLLLKSRRTDNAEAGHHAFASWQPVNAGRKRLVLCHSEELVLGGPGWTEWIFRLTRPNGEAD